MLSDKSFQTLAFASRRYDVEFLRAFNRCRLPGVGKAGAGRNQIMVRLAGNFAEHFSSGKMKFQALGQCYFFTPQSFHDNDAEPGQGDDDTDKKNGQRNRPTEAYLPSSVRAISASDLPPRRTEAASVSMSCTAPARQTPTTNQTNPGM